MSDLMNDHARGCEGREYTCTCGYDAQQDARIAALSRNLDHWRHEVGKLNSRIDRVEADQEECRKVIRFALGWVRHWQEDVASDLKPTPESLAMVEAKLKDALEDLP